MPLLHVSPGGAIVTPMKRIGTLALFFASCAFLYWRIISSPQIASDLNALPADVERVFQFHPEKDPAIGAKIARFAERTSSNSAKPTLVVIGGPCTECSIHAFDPMTIDPQAYSRILLIYQVTEDMVPKRIRTMRRPFMIITDPSEELATMLNGVWFPRFYAFSSDGKLLALQKRKDMLAPFVHLRSLRHATSFGIHAF